MEKFSPLGLKMERFWCGIPNKPLIDNAKPLVFSPDGATFVSRTNNGTIQIWDVATGDQIAALDEHAQGVSSLAFSPDGTTLVSTSMDGTIFLWDWDKILN